MFDLESFTLTQMIQLQSSLRKLGNNAQSMEEAADRIVRHLYGSFVFQQNSQQACVLVRLFKTHSYGDLDETLRRFADTKLGSAKASPAMKCLVLLASAGEKPEWNSRLSSAGHKAIPLPGEEAIASLPMFSRLFSQLGLSASKLLAADPTLIIDIEQSSFNVFHVHEAEGSPYVPLQKEFVIPYGVKSVIGFGGLLPSADMFAVIMFSRVRVPRDTADLFKPLALSAKLAIVPFGDRVFA